MSRARLPRRFQSPTEPLFFWEPTPAAPVLCFDPEASRIDISMALWMDPYVLLSQQSHWRSPTAYNSTALETLDFSELTRLAADLRRSSARYSRLAASGLDIRLVELSQSGLGARHPLVTSLRRESIFIDNPDWVVSRSPLFAAVTAERHRRAYDPSVTNLLTTPESRALYDELITDWDQDPHLAAVICT